MSVPIGWLVVSQVEARAYGAALASGTSTVLPTVVPGSMSSAPVLADWSIGGRWPPCIWSLVVRSIVTDTLNGDPVDDAGAVEHARDRCYWPSRFTRQAGYFTGVGLPLESGRPGNGSRLPMTTAGKPSSSPIISSV